MGLAPPPSDDDDEEEDETPPQPKSQPAPKPKPKPKPKPTKNTARVQRQQDEYAAAWSSSPAYTVSSDPNPDNYTNRATPLTPAKTKPPATPIIVPDIGDAKDDPIVIPDTNTNTVSTTGRGSSTAPIAIDDDGSDSTPASAPAPPTKTPAPRGFARAIASGFLDLFQGDVDADVDADPAGADADGALSRALTKYVKTHGNQGDMQTASQEKVHEMARAIARRTRGTDAERAQAVLTGLGEIEKTAEALAAKEKNPDNAWIAAFFSSIDAASSKYAQALLDGKDVAALGDNDVAAIVGLLTAKAVVKIADRDTIPGLVAHGGLTKAKKSVKFVHVDTKVAYAGVVERAVVTMDGARMPALVVTLDAKTPPADILYAVGYTSAWVPPEDGTYATLPGDRPAAQFSVRDRLVRRVVIQDGYRGPVVDAYFPMFVRTAHARIRAEPRHPTTGRVMIGSGAQTGAFVEPIPSELVYTTNGARGRAVKLDGVPMSVVLPPVASMRVGERAVWATSNGAIGNDVMRVELFRQNETEMRVLAYAYYEQ